MYAFACAILFAYISSASFIIQNHYGYSPLIFSICFAVNSVFIGIGAGIVVSAGILQLFIFNLFDAFPVYEALTLVMLTGVGYVFTASTTLTMTEGRAYIGAASALFGAAGFLFGGIISPLVGIGDILHSTSAAMLICSIIILILAFVSIRRKQQLATS